MCGVRRTITSNSFMLLHQPSMIWAGKRDEFIDEIENQKHIYDKLTKIYLERSKMKKKELDDLLKHELWLPAERCLELGLVDEIL
jgi:ATP-dependent protease ClpP protease subunit